MLSHDERRRLDELEAACGRDDARFARGLRDGSRRYRTRLILFLGSAGTIVLFVGVVTVAPALIMVGLVTCVAAGTVHSSRALDSPPRQRRRRLEE